MLRRVNMTTIQYSPPLIIPPVLSLDSNQPNEIHIVEPRAFDMAEQGPAMGMNNITDSFIFIYSRLSCNVCSIELSKGLTMILGIFLPGYSRFCWVVQSIKRPLPIWCRGNACQTVLSLGVLDN